MLARAGIEADVVETESPLHGTQLMKALPLNKYIAIVSISGDGLLHELLNGLLDRPDWPQAVKTPFAIVRSPRSGAGRASCARLTDTTAPSPPARTPDGRGPHARFLPVRPAGPSRAVLWTLLMTMVCTGDPEARFPPPGSGNAIAKSMDCEDPAAATFALIRGTSTTRQAPSGRGEYALTRWLAEARPRSVRSIRQGGAVGYHGNQAGRADSLLAPVAHARPDRRH